MGSSKKHKKHKSDKAIDNESEGGNTDKPLKLVLNLKVGGTSQETVTDEAGSPVYSEERNKHKHKKKKKKKSSDRDRERPRHEEAESLKRPHEDDDSADEDEEDEGNNAVTEKAYSQRSENDEDSDGNSSPSRRLRERAMRDDDGVILKQMLNFLLKTLQNKDTHGFFAFPVTDNIAPGYSSIILHPMDFSTMANKIEAGEYCNVMEFKKDFNLMCNNAMTYNQPDTIYYKEAKRLLHLGVRQLSKEKLLHLKKTHSFLSSITLKELGFDESGHVMEVPAPPAPDPILDKVDEVNTEPEINRVENEEEAAEEILALAKQAAEEAERTLVARKPKTDLGFLRLEDDGTTTMTVLNPWNDGKVSSTQRVISLGDYMGKLKNGTGSLFKFKEDKRNKVCPETYLCYGPFSSHAPAYDSSFASCTKEESDLLLSAYGGEIGVQYAKSVEKFVENAGISALEMVDKLLDTLTNGQHSKTKIIQEQQKRREEEMAERALQDEMIAKAQKAAEEAELAANKDPVQRKLNETAAILSELTDTQTERLSQDPPSHYKFLPQPSDKESDLANQVTSNLMSMTRQVCPSDVVSTKAVRGALGITTEPVPRSEVATTANGRTRPRSGVEGDSDDDSDDDSGDDDEDEGERPASRIGESVEEEMETLVGGAGEEVGGVSDLDGASGLGLGGASLMEDEDDGLGLLRQFDEG